MRGGQHGSKNMPSSACSSTCQVADVFHSFWLRHMSMYCGLLQDSCYPNVSTVGKRWQYLQCILKDLLQYLIAFSNPLHTGKPTRAYVDLLQAVRHLLVLVQCQSVMNFLTIACSPAGVPACTTHWQFHKIAHHCPGLLCLDGFVPHLVSRVPIILCRCTFPVLHHF